MKAGCQVIFHEFIRLFNDRKPLLYIFLRTYNLAQRRRLNGGVQGAEPLCRILNFSSLDNNFLTFSRSVHPSIRGLTPHVIFQIVASHTYIRPQGSWVIKGSPRLIWDSWKLIQHLLFQTFSISSFGCLIRQYTRRALMRFSAITFNCLTSKASPLRHIWKRMRARRWATATTAF